MIVLKDIKYPDFEMNEWVSGTIYIYNEKIFFRKLDKPKIVKCLKGKFCVPSFIEPHSHIGVCRKGEQKTSKALIDKTPFNPFKNILNKFSFEDKAFSEVERAGISYIGIDPGSTSYISGNGIIIKLPEKKIFDKANILKIALGSVPFEFQSSNLGLKNESDAIEKLKKFILNNQKIFHDKIIKFHVYSEKDISDIIRLKNKLPFRIIILHGNELFKMNKEFLKRINGYILGPLMHTSLRKEGQIDVMKSIIHLYKEGIDFSITTDHPVTPLRYLRFNAIS